GTVQMGINSLQATPALRLRVRNCYFGGSSSSARLNDAIKYDTGCSYGEFFFNTIEEMQGAISGTGYGVLAGAVDALKCMGNSVYGATGRGRHAFYLSTGARYCQIVNNFSTGMNQEHITLNALVSQGDNAYNIVQGNVCVGGNPDPSTGAISVWGKNTANTIADNVIISPGQMGIVVSSLNAPGGDCPSVDNIVRDNLIYLAGTRGIEVIGTSRTWLSGNRIRESSQISAGVSSNIRLVASSGGQGVTDCLVTGNYSDGPTNARSAFQINASAPTPTGTYLAGNHFPVCNVTDIELGSVSVSGTTQQVGVIAKRITITYSASMTIDASIGNEFDITATNGTAFTINAPTNPVDGQAITVTIANNSGGALGAVTWNAVFKMSAWTQPANNNNRSITFKYNGTNWQQISQTGVDVPN
ncbi:MAG TPA: hypothetical protein VK626_01840, partial [Nitrospiraceae bacterium]|nr:hypothetical protein [Nitrospiraceae bacterium]